MEEEYSDEQVTMNNGRCVMDALLQNGATTGEDLLKSFAEATGQPLDGIEDELMHVLNNGVAGGFILKMGDRYAVPRLDFANFETDADKKCEHKKETSPNCMAVTLGENKDVEIKITVSNSKGKRKAEDDAGACASTCSSHSSKKKRMYEDDDDGEDFKGFDCKS